MPLFEPDPSSSDSLPPPAPVRCAADALRVVRLAITQPLEPETLAFVLDAQGTGGVITLVSGTVQPDSVLAVAECIARAAEHVPRVAALVLATVRPGGGVLPGDVDRWLEASELVQARGLRLLEWFVIADGYVCCPRDLFGEPERWGSLRTGSPG
ncbi:MAG: hypothetical protein Q7V57_10075 [Actinomycetota bacterium]|nr:hypothetical protein [Actinomycetota bacterium]